MPAQRMRNVTTSPANMRVPMLFLRKWFGDRVYDKAVMSTVK